MAPAASKKKPDWFLIGMLAAVLLAWLFPEPGAQGGWLHPELLVKLGVALVFFLHGVALATDALKAGASRWKLHLVVQGTTFLFFPLLGLALMPLGGHLIPADLQMGFFFLCALPSTVSSSVAMTAAAKGNVAAAVFNATLSSLLGIALTPLWMTFVPHQGTMPPLGGVILDLMLWLLLPLMLGQLSRPLLGGWASRNKPLIHVLDRGTILLLLYTSFCDSVQWGVWTGHSPLLLIETLLAVLALFFIVLWFTQALCHRLGFDHADKVAAVFCGSKKSLAQGVPMAQLMFAGNPALGMILLPIMLYHPLQLLICGVLAGRWAKQSAAQSTSAG